MTRDDTIQWIGALFIISGHALNAIGPAAYPWNIAAFTIGTIMFLLWSYRQRNMPQLAVNVVAITICTVGLFQAVG